MELNPYESPAAEEPEENRNAAPGTTTSVLIGLTHLVLVLAVVPVSFAAMFISAWVWATLVNSGVRREEILISSELVGIVTGIMIMLLFAWGASALVAVPLTISERTKEHPQA